MGLAFEKLLPGQEHRRVVPLVKTDKGVQIAPCGLIEHKDTKYSAALEDKGELIDLASMFSF
jgi:hypothetical protein